MKINRITMFVCGIVTILSGIAIVLIDHLIPDNMDDSIIQSIMSGIFTGFIISLVVATIGYFHEKNVIMEKTDTSIKSLYINMVVLSRTVGKTLPKIHTETNLQQLHFDNISGLSKLNVECLEKVELGLFDPIFKEGKLAQVYIQLRELQQVTYNIRNRAMDLEIQAGTYTCNALTLENERLKGIPVSTVDSKNLEDLKNLINIRTAKFHEYVTGQTFVLEKIADSFYTCKNGKDKNDKRRNNKQSWKTIQANLRLQIDDIMR